ncbi:hypothetical protein P3T76_002245 [Phytophthora citrophthora]|uniref:Uncharacterized protein n=1 Tax=Phytophthora citrophthora TaxID=4793 RepID=A0AAD9GYN8_9STRA|nr:hypothetical protein P3T76_002245 [Phytophthora citrophthora]
MTHAQKYCEKIAQRKKAKADATKSSPVQVVDENCRNTQEKYSYKSTSIDWIPAENTKHIARHEEWIDIPYIQYPDQSG